MIFVSLLTGKAFSIKDRKFLVKASPLYYNLNEKPITFCIKEKRS